MWADYAPGTVGMFPRYSSTTKSRDVACNFSRHGPAAAGNYDGRQCLFKIYLSKKNEPVTHVDLANGENPTDFSFYPSEEEVLLLPYFCFQVIEIITRNEGKDPKKYKGKEYDKMVTEIVLMEIPFQDLLATK